ncbi:sulfur carrier protein ThiS [Salmonella enterica subsp. enterica]|nr:sulfur carrier protein ThiS [Salmonella enterica subsp. enterica]
MQIQFNDELMQCAAGQPSAGCFSIRLNQLKPGAALALNQQILPREQWQQQIVQEGDQILLFHVIAGG